MTRRFGGLVANSDVSLAVAEGEILGLIGPNGAGKSTLFNLIAGLYPPTAGRIFFEGEDITRLSAPRRCALGIARTFQVVRSFDSMSVVENVIVGALMRRAGAREARHKALAGARAHRAFPRAPRRRPSSSPRPRNGGSRSRARSRRSRNFCCSTRRSRG